MENDTHNGLDGLSKSASNSLSHWIIINESIILRRPIVAKISPNPSLPKRGVTLFCRGRAGGLERTIED
jgi:hypothetical protein